MWDLSTIKQRNAVAVRVYDLGDSKFASGRSNTVALNVVRRVRTADGRGRPRYVTVAGRRPFLSPELLPIKASALLRAALETL